MKLLRLARRHPCRFVTHKRTPGSGCSRLHTPEAEEPESFFIHVYGFPFRTGASMPMK